MGNPKKGKKTSGSTKKKNKAVPAAAVSEEPMAVDDEQV